MDKKQRKNYMFLIFFTALLFLLVMKIELVLQLLGTVFSILTPIFISIAIAFVLYKPYRFFLKLYCMKLKKEKPHKIASMLSIFSVYILFLGAVAGIVRFIIPQLIDSVALFTSNIDTYSGSLNDFIQRTIDFLRLNNIDMTSIRENIDNILTGTGNVISFLFPQIYDFTAGLILSVFNIFLGFILSIYLLADNERLLRQIRKLVLAYLPEKASTKLFEVQKITSETFSKFILGQVIEALILGVMCFIGMTLLRFPYPLLISTIVGITALVPIVGAIVGAVPGILILLMIEPISALWFIVFIIILQQLEGNLIYPKVVGESIGLPAIWVLLAVIVSGGIAGILGILIGVPLASVLYQILSQDADRKIETKKRINSI